jgi:hypothetical protein
MKSKLGIRFFLGSVMRDAFLAGVMSSCSGRRGVDSGPAPNPLILMIDRGLRLCAVFLAAVLCQSAAFAGFTLQNNTLTVSTSALSLSFQGLTLNTFQNALTGEQYIQTPKPFVLAITNQQGIAVPAPAPWALGTDSSGNQTAVITVTDGVNSESLTISLSGDDAIFTVHGGSTTPGLVSYQWAFQGLNITNAKVFSPSEAGMYYDLTSPVGDLGDDYPVHWEAQMAVYETANGGFSFQGLDQGLNFKTIHGSFLTGTLVLGVEIYAPAPYPTATAAADTQWIIRAHQGSWQTPASQYRTWTRGNSPSVYSGPTYDWVKNIGAVVTVQNLDPAILPLLASSLVPSKTLLYLQNWRLQAYDTGYPDYTPATNAASFIQQAHALGFRVMLHTNILGMATSDPNYATMQQYQMRDPQTLALQGWDWTVLAPGNPQRFAYISPCSSAFRQLFINNIGVAIKALQPDALHLDAGGAIVNDGQGLLEGMNSAQGIRLFHQQILAAFPGLVLGGESTSELISPYNAFAQRWNEPTLPHPISTFLFGDQTQFYGFLDQPAPDDPAFITYVQRYEGQGIMPTATVGSVDDLAASQVRMGILLQEMRLWQDRGYAPDWADAWPSGRIFQFKSADGTSLATIDSASNTIALNIDGSQLYKRVFGVAQFSTPDYILNWPAFDATTLYGLNPQNQYWLEQPSITRPANLAHITSVPPNYSVGAGSMITPDFTYIDLDEASQTWFDFVGAFPTATSGLLYGTSAQDAVQVPMGYGAVSKIAPITVGGVQVPAALYMVPPYTPAAYAGGAVFTDYTISVPAANSATLSFQVGIDDLSTHAIGALTAIKIGDNLVWGSRTVPIKPGAWVSGSVDLTAYAGSSVTVRFIVDAPLPEYAQTTWVGWTNIALNVNLAIPSASLSASAASVPAAASADAVLQPGSAGNWQVGTALPGSFVVFPTAPTMPALGTSLLALPFLTWRQSDAGLATLGSYNSSGGIVEVTSGGVSEKASIVADPPNEGYTILTWTLRVPPDATSLSVVCGLADAPPTLPLTIAYSGMRFSVRINGNEVWGQQLQAAGWFHQSIPLNSFQGQNILLELVGDSQGTNVFDWGQWADLTFYPIDRHPDSLKRPGNRAAK